RASPSCPNTYADILRFASGVGGVRRGWGGRFIVSRRFVARALQRAAGLGEEDVVERGRVELQVLDVDALRVERPNDLGELSLASVEAGGDAARRRGDPLTEALHDGSGALAVVLVRRD